MQKHYTLEQIGIIKTPYQDKAPYQPVEEDTEVFYMEITPSMSKA